MFLSFQICLQFNSQFLEIWSWLTRRHSSFGDSTASYDSIFATIAFNLSWSCLWRSVTLTCETNLSTPAICQKKNFILVSHKKFNCNYKYFILKIQYNNIIHQSFDKYMLTYSSMHNLYRKKFFLIKQS